MSQTAETERKEQKEIKSTVIAEVPRSESEVVRISLGRYNGTSFVDVRLFYREKGSGELRATRKGIAIRGELRKVIEGLLQAEEAASAHAA